MDEAQWLACTDPTLMMEFLGDNASERKVRLFGCACCRDSENLLTQVELREAVEVAEQYVDGLANADALEAAYQRASRTYWITYTTHLVNGNDEAANAALRTYIATSVAAPVRRFYNFYPRRSGTAQRVREMAPDEEVRRCELVRDIFNSFFPDPLIPFRPLPQLDPAWLAWGDGGVRRIAQNNYAHGFGEMLLLADALEDAGCTDATILAHCRGPGPHVRGCWVVDWLLGRS